MAEAVVIAAVWLPVLGPAVVLHELAHGWVADRCGDPTARRMGRLSLNPIVHLDWFGTVLLPLMLLLIGAPFLFGYAKPVPVDFTRLRHPRRDMILVAAAGPATNLVLATAFALLAGLIEHASGEAFRQWLVALVEVGVTLNLVLALFNLIPIPPLDGGRIAVGLLPDRLAAMLARIEPWGMILVILLIASGALGVLYANLVAPIAEWMIRYGIGLWS